MEKIELIENVIYDIGTKIPEYINQPPGTKVAEWDDFVKFNKLNLDMPFLVQSFHTNLFSVYYVSDTLTYEKLKPWLDENRVFVKK